MLLTFITHHYESIEIKQTKKLVCSKSSNTIMLLKVVLSVFLFGFIEVLLLEKVDDQFPYKLLQKPECNSYKGNFTKLTLIVKSAVKNVKRRNAIRETWGNEKQNLPFVNIRTVFNIGYTSLAVMRQKVIQESVNFKDIIESDFEDTYENLTIKTAMGIKWAKRMCESSDFFLFVDDDIYILLSRLVHYIRWSRFDRNTRLYLGHVNWNLHPTRNESNKKAFVSLTDYSEKVYPPYVSGGCVILSRRSLEAMSVGMQQSPFIRFDDVFMGVTAMTMGIHPTHLNEAMSFFKGNFSIFQTAIVVTSFNHKRIRYIRKYLNTRGWH